MSVDIEQPGELQLNVAVNSSLGEATASATGGTSPYSYQWSDSQNQTSATATGLTPGPYTVTLTDANGCEIMQNIQIIPSVIATNAIAVNLSLFPSPTNDFVQLSWSPEFVFSEFAISNDIGEILIVKKPSTRGFCLVNLQSLSSGIYFLQAYGKSGKFTRKLFKH